MLVTANHCHRNLRVVYQPVSLEMPLCQLFRFVSASIKEFIVIVMYAVRPATVSCRIVGPWTSDLPYHMFEKDHSCGCQDRFDIVFV